MTLLPDANELAVQLTVWAAGLTAAGYLATRLWRGLTRLIRWGRRLARQADAMAELLARELDTEHGGSMKGDVAAIARQLGMAQRRLNVLERRLERALLLAAEHHPEHATEYLRKD